MLDCLKSYSQQKSGENSRSIDDSCFFFRQGTDRLGRLLSAIDGHVDNRNQVFTKEWDAFLLFLVQSIFSSRYSRF